MCVCMNACYSKCMEARTQLLGLFSLILCVPEIVFLSFRLSEKNILQVHLPFSPPQENLNYWPIISQKARFLIYLSSNDEWNLENVLVFLNSPVNFWLHALHGRIQFSMKLISRMLLILKTLLLSLCHLCLSLNFINVS